MTKALSQALSMLFLACALLISDKTSAGDSDIRFSYYANGRIYVDKVSEITGKHPIVVPPEKEWQDFKPSWSMTGDMLVFFRRVKNDPRVVNWKTILYIVNADGTGLQKLTDGNHTNFNPTWTRDGKNSPIWNRKHPQGHFMVIRSMIGNKPEIFETLTDKSYHNWVHSSLADGRLLVESNHPEMGYGYYLMTPKPKGKSTYERIDDGGLLRMGLLIRISVSSDEKMITFGHLKGHKRKTVGYAISIADLDIKNLKIANARVIANEKHEPFWYDYPRWTKDSKSVIYHANTTGKGRLFLYILADGSTRQVSRNNDVDFRYPHVEDAPK